MKLKSLIVLLLIVCLMGVVSVGLTAFAESEEWKIEELSTYSVGDDFIVPEATVTVGSKVLTASSTLVYPNGDATTSKNITLSQYGRYTISYVAENNGKIYCKDVIFMVEGKIASLSSEKSSYYYGKYEWAKNESGLMVSLVEGDKITFNKAIDVSNVTSADSLIKCFAAPEVKGSPDFEKLVFTFTDAENPDIYVRVFARQSSEGYDYPASYYLAGGQNQPMVGWEESWKRLHINNEWGTQARHSFSLLFGAWGITWADPDANQIDLRYDLESNSMYVGSLMITDFDNPSFFNELWTGFPSGKVFLSIEGAMYTSDKANFCVTYVKDNDLLNDVFVDTEGPEITIDWDDSDLPLAKLDTPYNVPGASAKDLYSENVELKTFVWYNYGTSNAVLTQINDGAFIPDKLGRYAIEYESTDYSGNVTRKILYTKCVREPELPQITFSEEPQKTAYAGEILKPIGYSVTSSGNWATVEITAKINGETVVVGEEGLRLNSIGVYEIVYTATDYIGQANSSSYSVNVTPNGEPLFLDDPVIPSYFISGSAYSIDDFYAYDYSSGSEQKILASVTVTDENGTVPVASGGIFVPKTSVNGALVKVTFAAGGSKLTKEIPCVLPYIEENGRQRLHVENYIMGDVSTEKQEGFTVITANGENTVWTFANSLVARDSELVFSGVKGKSNYSGVTVFFTDSLDPANTIVASFVKGVSTTDLYVNGSKTTLNFTFDSQTEFTISYDGESGFVVNNASVAITNREDGKPFTGFNGKVYVGMRFDDGVKGSAIRLYSVDGQPMRSSAVSDRVGPKIVVNGVYGGIVDMGSIVTLPSADASDVLDPITTLKVSVYAPDGSIVTDVDGRKLQNVNAKKSYSIKIKAYGQYRVSYEAQEGSLERPNTSTLIYVLNVIDNVAPEIEFKHSFPTEVAVGEYIILPDYTLSDNVSTEENIKCYKFIVDPSGTVNALSENSNSLRATRAGIYEIRLMIYDEAGNINMIQRFVSVK